LKEPEEEKEEQEPRTNRLQQAAAILLLALIVFVGSDAYFNNWSIVRTLVSLNTLQLKDKSGKNWDLLARRDFQIMKVKDVRRVVNADSLVSFDQPYRDAGFYRLYFRNSDSSSARLQRMYQALLNADSSQTVKHTVEDAERAYRNLQRILHAIQSVPIDSGSRGQHDTTIKISKGDLALGSGDETASVIRKIVSNPSVLIGAGIGIAASAGVDLLRGDAYVAFSKENVFRIDSIAVGSRVGSWEGSPIDILWMFAPKDTAVEKKTTGSRDHKERSDE
jgi:hypothetical protein